MRPNVFQGVFLILALGAGLFFLKHTVEEKEQHLAGLKARYLEDQKAVRVLKAEWAYLNSPQYLQSLASQYLDVKPVGSRQVAAWSEDLPRRHVPAPVVAVAYGGAGEYLDERAITSGPPKPGRGDEP